MAEWAVEMEMDQVRQLPLEAKARDRRSSKREEDSECSIVED